MSRNVFKSQHTCPWWLIFTFDNPLRKLVHNPQKILGPYIQPGNTVLDVGCGMGYFSVGMARLVGEKGKVIAADLQPEMLAGLRHRANHQRLTAIIEPHLCETDKINIPVPLDFALTFWMVHEVRQPQALLAEIYAALKPGGHYLLVEPLVHVSGAAFAATVAQAQAVGFAPVEQPAIALSRAVLFRR